MDSATLMSEKFQISKKLETLQHGYVETIEGLPVSDLEDNLLIYAKQKEEVITALKTNKEIKDQKDVLKELTGPFNDTLKALGLKMNYIHLLIKEKNGDISESEEA